MQVTKGAREQCFGITVRLRLKNKTKKQKQKELVTDPAECI